MKWLTTWLFRLGCKHDYRWQRNIYGDEIIMLGYHRSWWACTRCGKWVTRPELRPEAPTEGGT